VAIDLARHTVCPGTKALDRENNALPWRNEVAGCHEAIRIVPDAHVVLGVSGAGVHEEESDSAGWHTEVIGVIGDIGEMDENRTWRLADSSNAR
jgi:hypothetical protein